MGERGTQREEVPGAVAVALRASSVENQRLRGIIERLRAEAMTDCLTGLANRRAVERRLSELWSASARRGHELGCIAMDIDGLKRVNDTLGHAAGDELINIAAETIRSSVRESDFIARTGGDEFVVLLPMTSLEGARLLADRIGERFAENTAGLRARLREHALPEVRVVVGRAGALGGHGDRSRTGAVGISAGVAARIAGGWPSATAILDSADRALYEAKRARSGGRAKLAA